MAKAILNVPDISCDHCERVITKALGAVDGVQNVAVSIPAKQVTVAYDDTRVSVDRMKEVLQEEEYPVASVR